MSICPLCCWPMGAHDLREVFGIRTLVCPKRHPLLAVNDQKAADRRALPARYKP